MSISGCILAKNEGALIEGCIKSMVNCVDEIILVDNGSTDNTLDIAAKYGCNIIDGSMKVLDKARNIYLAASNCDWILTLDADERIMLDDQKKIKDLARNSVNKCYSLPIINYLGSGNWYQGNAARLFVNDPMIRYNDLEIHASIKPSIRASGYNIQNADIPIHHLDILVKGRTRKKRDIYTEKLKNLANSFSGNNFNFLGEEYVAIGDYAEAEKCFIKALNTNKQNNEHAVLFLAFLYLHQHKYDFAKAKAEALISAGSKLIEYAYNILAKIAYEQGDFTHSIELCNKIIGLGKYSPHAYLNIAAMYYFNDNLHKMFDYVNRALTINPMLLNGLIYAIGETPNLFSYKSMIFNPEFTIFKGFLRYYSFIGNNTLVKEWAFKEQAATKDCGENLNYNNFI